MRKRIILVISAALTFCFVACGRDHTDSSTVNTDNTPVAEDYADTKMEIDTGTNEDMETKTDVEINTGAGESRILIAYFSVPENVDISGVDAVASASVVVKDGEKLGNTEYVANLIQETIGGDLFRIETTETYPLDHDPLVDQAAEEQDAGVRPTLATSVENFEQYEYIFLGFPNWWADMPMAVYSFLEEYDFGDKTIIPFITHGGSRASNTIETISQLQPDALILGNELILSRGDVAESEESVVTWVQELGIFHQAK